MISPTLKQRLDWDIDETVAMAAAICSENQCKKYEVEHEVDVQLRLQIFKFGKSSGHY